MSKKCSERSLRNFFVPFVKIFVPLNFEQSLRKFFVPFGTFFAHDSKLPTTRTTTTTKFLLGPLSLTRDKKPDKVINSPMNLNL